MTDQLSLSDPASGRAAVVSNTCLARQGPDRMTGLAANVSVEVSSLVWKAFPRGGSELLVLLAMADYADKEGGSVFPSVATVARKARLSEAQARRIIRRLVAERWVRLVVASIGGSKTATNQYEINLSKLAEPLAPVIPVAEDDTPSAGDTPPLAPTLPLPLAPMRDTPSAGARRSVIYPSLQPSGEPLPSATACADRRRTRSKPSKVTWTPDGGWEGIDERMKSGWLKAYPACDIERQLAAMTAWLLANPKKAYKSAWLRFVTNWLARSQDRGGDTQSRQPNGHYISPQDKEMLDDALRKTNELLGPF